MKIFKIIFILVVYSTILFSQSSSTYTRNGIGDLSYTYSARSLGIAQTGSAMLNDSYVELINPASWSKLSLTRIEFSLVLNGIELSDNSNNAYYSDSDFKGFTFAFPISTKYGIGFASGLLPYSRVSYQVVETTNTTDPVLSNYTTNFTGEGGLSRLFIGASYRLPFDWILGATIEYYFGRQTYLSEVEFTNSSFRPSTFEVDYRSTGFGTTIGIISQNFASLFNSETISNLRLGVSVNLISELNTDTSLTINPKIVADTIVSGRTTMHIPIRIAGGVSMELYEKYNFNLDYIYQPWSEYTLGGVISPNLRDVHRFALGFEYAKKLEPGSTNWEQIKWRLGLSYELTQYIINKTDITQFTASAGVSFPLGAGNSFDLGLEFALRGTIESNLTKEKFYRINIGISFGELWFQTVQR
ncbi:MAG: hypothetical protein O6940_08125 [Ignavibacteria bacterium]|nr:hypothetical protein [Ignavibacteria bacterium]